MKSMIIIFGIVVIGLIAGGAWWMTTNKDTADQTTTNSTSDQQLDKKAVEAAATITYTDKGFSMSTDTVPVGSTVLIVNNSSGTLEFSSDPHPQHTDNPELNVPTLSPGEQETMVIDKPGTWGFHNHLNDDHTGSLTVTN